MTEREMFEEWMRRENPMTLEELDKGNPRADALYKLMYRAWQARAKIEARKK